MSISYPLSMPATPAPKSIIMAAVNMVSVATSPFTGQTQIQQWPGEWWEALIVLPSMLKATAEPWNTFLVSLRGRYGTFYLGDPSRKTPQGVATGTPLVSGAQSGGANTLATKGWTANVTGILQAGDYIQLGTTGGGHITRLHKVLTTANSDASGNATLDIFPVIRAEGVTDGEAIITASPVGTFRLAGDFRSWSVTAPATFGGIQIRAVESL